MRLKHLFLSLTLFCFWPSGAFSDSRELTLKEILKSLKEFHPLIFAAFEEQRSAEGELLASEGAFDPSIKLDSSNQNGYYNGGRSSVILDQPLLFNGSRVFGGYRRSDGKIADYDGAQETLNGGEFNAGFEIPLLRDGPTDRRRVAIGRAGIQREVASANVEDRKIQLTRASTNAYWEWVAAGWRLHIAQELLRVAKERDKQLSERVKHGDLPAFDQLDNNRQVLQRETQVVAAERALQQISFELSLVLREQVEGNNGKPVVPQKEQLPKRIIPPTKSDAEDFDSSLAKAFINRPELKRLENQRSQTRLDLELAKNQAEPRVDLQLLASQDTGDGSKTQEEGVLKAGIKIELPLRVRTAEGRQAVAEAKDRELVRLIEFARDRISADVKDAISAISLSKDRISFAQKELKAAEQLADGERTRFDHGDSNLIFVNLREQTAAEAAIREVDALLDYQRSLAFYRAALAKTFEELVN
jgi:cobalt-zinc-cadmium efflux system outer membrane protein